MNLQLITYSYSDSSLVQCRQGIFKFIKLYFEVYYNLVLTNNTFLLYRHIVLQCTMRVNLQQSLSTYQAQLISSQENIVKMEPHWSSADHNPSQMSGVEKTSAGWYKPTHSRSSSTASSRHSRLVGTFLDVLNVLIFEHTQIFSLSWWVRSQNWVV